MAQSNRNIELVVVGDHMVGKTSLLVTYVTGNFPEILHIRCGTDNGYSACMQCDGAQINLTLMDTAGQEDFDCLRPLYYPSADAFLLCFSVDNNSSYEKISTKWHPEVRHYRCKAPLILVGTKTDLRDCASDQPKEHFITIAQGKKMATQIKAIKYVECSAKAVCGVREVFEEAVRAFLNQKPPRSKTHKCRLL